MSLFERLQGERYCTTNSDTKSDKDGTDPGTDNVQEDSQKVLENLKAEGEKLKTEAQDFKVHKKKNDDALMFLSDDEMPIYNKLYHIFNLQCVCRIQDKIKHTSMLAVCFIRY